MEEKVKVYSVNELTQKIKSRLESNFKQIWVSGEISNFSKSATGHFYFSIKDEYALISCALFRGIANSINIVDFFKLQSLSDLGNYKLVQEKIVGKKVKVFGDISVYAKSGSYQIIVKKMEMEGLGGLQQKFEELKNKLLKKGYFAEERKKKIPPFPQRIGVITSPTGAAVRDILNVTRRRWNSASIILYPAVVQGAEAAEDIARGIRLFNSYKNVDVIIVGRGGGSLEDLWAFNEEVVATAIYESQIPVISAVGHEVDFSIADFTADLRAPTPSAAAELVVRDKKEVAEFVSNTFQALHRIIQRYIDRYEKDLVNLSENRLKHDLMRRLEHYKEKLASFSQEKLTNSLVSLIGQSDKELSYVTEKFFLTRQYFLDDKKNAFVSISDKLSLLDPLAILKRGYSVTYNAEDNSIIKDAGNVSDKMRIRTIVASGEFDSVITKVKRG